MKSAAALQAAGGVGSRLHGSTITNALVTFSFDDLLATARASYVPLPPTGSVCLPTPPAARMSNVGSAT